VIPDEANGTVSRRPRWRFVWWLGGSVVALCALILIGLLVVYPRVGASKLKSKIRAKVDARLGREVAFGEVEVRLGHATIRNLDIHGPNDGELPLVHIGRIEIDFDTTKSLYGSVELGDAIIEGVTVSVKRHADGRDNVRDLLERLAAPPAADGGEGGGARTLPASISITKVRVVADDVASGATLTIADGDARWRPGELRAQLRELMTAGSTGKAQRAGIAKLDVTRLAGQQTTIAVTSGELALWPRLSLSGITGTIAPDPANPGQYAIDLAGGYGGVPGTLWTAKGPLDPRAKTASIDLVADKFNLDRLAPILEQTAVVDYNSTSVDTKLHLDLAPTGARFAGELHLRGLNVGHPLIADKEVHGLDLSAMIAGSLNLADKSIQLDRGDFVARDLPFSVTGRIARATAPIEGPPIKLGPGGAQFLSARVVIPPIDCARALKAIPAEMVPYMAKYKLKGKFDANITLDIDWAKLDELKLVHDIGMKCKVLDEERDPLNKLKEPFEHHVEVIEDEWQAFLIGPENENFVAYADISPYLVSSILTTEDSAFIQHKGFIPTEFRTALINNLKAGKFTHGASSITMQTVKNVLLYREKTLARKLQELFLTWRIEQVLDKERILEIYFNAIEYGPGLYGIGPAARQFFGKEPRNLNAHEAAYFSTILPGPKERYKQYCTGTLTKWTEDKILRILDLMVKRERLTKEEYDLAVATPLVFVKDGTETEEECLKRTNDVIKNARSTNPLAPKDKAGKKGKKKGDGRSRPKTKDVPK
jgi:hypothetical protein